MTDQRPRRPDEMPPTSTFTRHSGIRPVSVTPDLVVYEMPVTETQTNRNGVLHGGAIMTLADAAAGSAAFINIPADKSNTTVESKTNFLRAVRVGDVLTARCTPLHRGRTVMVFQIEMTRGDGKIAAMSTQTHMVIDWNGKRTKGGQE
ncbi:PaaI family thioesterase [Rhodospira trueperi]|uniref:Uncharacterized domain 1-containing protein n=1 Tax=Rhodospira trueperi TaxID=69960 RepID=A0A1G7GGC5_9PROT|nr:PaaI family thioesterase [Rhodospira trueperi]SDE87208.1 uncharacterized domain 1-containing protein [Rhodospira trueperi]